MFLHIFYDTYNKKNRVTPIDNVKIDIRKDTATFLFKKEELSFGMRILRIDYITNDNDGKMHIWIEGWDRKNRKVKVYTDNNNEKCPKKRSDSNSQLFTGVEIDSAVRNYKEI